MFDTTNATSAVKLALLESELMEGRMGRAEFVNAAQQLGLSQQSVEATADKQGCIARRFSSPVPDHQHVTIFHDVLLAFEAQQTFLANAGITAEISE